MHFLRFMVSNGVFASIMVIHLGCSDKKLNSTINTSAQTTDQEEINNNQVSESFQPVQNFRVEQDHMTDYMIVVVRSLPDVGNDNEGSSNNKTMRNHLYPSLGAASSDPFSPPNPQSAMQNLGFSSVKMFDCWDRGYDDDNNENIKESTIENAFGLVYNQLHNQSVGGGNDNLVNSDCRNISQYARLIGPRTALNLVFVTNRGISKVTYDRGSNFSFANKAVVEDLVQDIKDQFPFQEISFSWICEDSAKAGDWFTAEAVSGGKAFDYSSIDYLRYYEHTAKATIDREGSRIFNIEESLERITENKILVVIDGVVLKKEDFNIVNKKLVLSPKLKLNKGSKIEVGELGEDSKPN